MGRMGWRQLTAVCLAAMTLGLAPAQAEEAAETLAPDSAFHIQVIRQTPQPTARPLRVLIYHTHTYEAYAQVPDAPYKETEQWRTRDDTANVVAVGRALTASLTALGYDVTQDTTAFEPPVLSTSYARSLNMLEERAAAGETYDLYLDIHRDAIAASSTLVRTVNIGGQPTARFMVLVGKGTGEGFDVKPDWERNYALACRVTDSLNRQHEGLCRDVKLRTGRFNQHIAPCCLLIECGNNYNTLEEVISGIPYLAQAIDEALRAGDEGETENP